MAEEKNRAGSTPIVGRKWWERGGEKKCKGDDAYATTIDRNQRIEWDLG